MLEVDRMDENQEKKTEKVKKKKSAKTIIVNLFMYILLIVCFIALGYSGTVLTNWLITNQKSNEKINEVSNSVKVEPNTQLENMGATFGIDFDKLEQINSDVVGWINIKGTSIDYSILQAGDNDYYLRRSIDGNYSWFGWPFMDYRNSGEFTDRNTILYGHNITSGLMFADLENIVNGSYGNDIDVYIYTKDKTRVYKVFSTYIVDPEDYYLTTVFYDDEDFGEFVNALKNRSLIDFNVPVFGQDKIITLSTCTSDSLRRIVLHAKLYSVEEAV